MISRDLLEFIEGPIDSTKNRLLALLQEWQLDMANRILAGEIISASELQHWTTLAEIVEGYLAQIIYAITGADIYGSVQSD